MASTRRNSCTKKRIIFSSHLGVGHGHTIYSFRASLIDKSCLFVVISLSPEFLASPNVISLVLRLLRPFIDSADSAWLRCLAPSVPLWQVQRQLCAVDSSTRAAFKRLACFSNYPHYSTSVSHPGQTNVMASLSSYSNALVLLPPSSIAERIAPFRHVHDKV